MKKYLIAVIAVLSIAGTASAQTFNLGVKGGLNVYNLAGDDIEGTDAKVGFHLGLLGHIHVAKQFAIQPELVYSAQGAQSDGNDDVKLNLNYVNVPVLFQYMFDNGFRLEAGPQIGFNVSAKSKEGDTSVDIKDNIKGIDLSLAVGASYVHVPSGFGVDARYNHGLTSISENSSADIFNRGFQVGVFYLFLHKN